MTTIENPTSGSVDVNNIHDELSVLDQKINFNPIDFFENADEFYATVAKIPPEKFVDSDLVVFAKKPAVDLPYKSTLKNAVTIPNFKIFCPMCHRHISIFRKTTVDENFSCVEVRSGAYCHDCNQWTVNTFRYYPKTHHFLIYETDRWIEYRIEKSWFQRLLGWIGLG